MKRTLMIKTGISALVMLGLPWLAVTFAPGNAGMAICLLLFYAVYPIYAAVSGYSAGKDVKALWSIPVITAMLFLVGAWVFLDMGELQFLIYALGYLVIGFAAMFFRRLTEHR